MQKVDMQVMTPVINQKDAARDASNKPVPPTPRRKRRGLGMTDSGYVVLLTVFALVSVTTLFLTVRGNIRDNNMAQLFVQLVGNVEASFANTSTYPSTDLIPLLDAGGYIPASARAVASDGTVSIVTPYGHTLGISGTGSGYYIDIANLSKKACVKLLENAVVSSPTAVKGVSINTKAQTLPLTKTAIAAGCVPPNISIRVQF